MSENISVAEVTAVALVVQALEAEVRAQRDMLRQQDRSDRVITAKVIRALEGVAFRLRGVS